MKITANHINDIELTKLGKQVISLIKGREYKKLADQFGYALAYEENPVDVIKKEIDRCLSELGKHSKFTEINGAEIIVKYFEDNDIGLVAVVECTLPIENNSSEMFVELIVTEKEGEYYVTLEQISNAA